ncbi:MAG: glycyl-radical enzyme activating protein [Clostridia bacterium]|nr:glycyl-radical enzyme activating protein [Clostridia bacterium]
MDEILNVRGRIFDIQRFSVHDGPGVRTIVFLKGCPLRCRWCCNPESQSYEIEKMTQNGTVKTVGRDVTVEEVMQTVIKDRIYYRRSGGGLTLSGGEMLMQPEFALALLKAAKQNGITTAVESTAFAPFSTIEKLLPYIDTFLMDIKHIDSAKHKEYTTKPNELILENALRIAKSGTHLIVRTPVIPGFNDTADEIAAIARFASSLPGVNEMHILPYHRIGQDKYAGLSREYTLAHLTPPPTEQMEGLLKVVCSYGLEGKIGG